MITVDIRTHAGVEAQAIWSQVICFRKRAAELAAWPKATRSPLPGIDPSLVGNPALSESRFGGYQAVRALSSLFRIVTRIGIPPDGTNVTRAIGLGS